MTVIARDFSTIQRAFRKINRGSRGSDAEYTAVTQAESDGLAPYRERAIQSAQAEFEAQVRRMVSGALETLLDYHRAVEVDLNTVIALADAAEDLAILLAALYPDLRPLVAVYQHGVEQAETEARAIGEE